MILNDLKLTNLKFLVNFSQFLAVAHNLRMICDNAALDRPRQPAHEIFSIERRFSSLRASR